MAFTILYQSSGDRLQETLMKWAHLFFSGVGIHKEGETLEAPPLQEVVREPHKCLDRDSSCLKLPRRLMGNAAASEAAMFYTIPSSCSGLPSCDEVLLCQRPLCLP